VNLRVAVADDAGVRLRGKLVFTMLGEVPRTLEHADRNVAIEWAGDRLLPPR